MGLRVLAGIKVNESEDRTGAVLYCSTGNRALPFIFDSEAEAEEFLARYGDIRRLEYKDQEILYGDFMKYGDFRTAEEVAVISHILG